ncbi:sulfurtransferase-like selenium metabolism protein YedF [Chloroflexota bacterium]
MKSKHILIQSEGLGTGDEKLGKLLMANFLRLLGEREDKPKAIIFWNTGVNLVCAGSQVLNHVQRLENSGVEILVCTTCLEYFNLTDKLSAGKPTTMMKSIESMFDGDFIAL